MNNVYKTFIVAFLLFFTEGPLFAQKHFQAAALAGINFSQIDGDDQEGYRKPGVSLGLCGSVYVRPDIEIGTELLYNVKGAKPNFKIPANGLGFDNKYFSTISLQYSEISVFANIHFNPNRSRKYYTRAVLFGLSYGRLLKASTSIVKYNSPVTELETLLSNRYNADDISYILGWSQLITPQIGIAIRHTRTFNFLYKDPTYVNKQNNVAFRQLQPFFLSFHVFYNFISPNKVMGLRIKKNRPNKNPLEELY
jgi:hypothetical protein